MTPPMPWVVEVVFGACGCDTGFGDVAVDPDGGGGESELDPDASPACEGLAEADAAGCAELDTGWTEGESAGTDVGVACCEVD